jgi:hypothetical protein
MTSPQQWRSFSATIGFVWFNNVNYRYEDLNSDYIYAEIDDTNYVEEFKLSTLLYLSSELLYRNPGAATNLLLGNNQSF